MDLVDIDKLLGDLELEDSQAPLSNAPPSTNTYPNGKSTSNASMQGLIDLSIESDFGIPEFTKKANENQYTRNLPKHEPFAPEVDRSIDDVLGLDFSIPSTVTLPPQASGNTRDLKGPELVAEKLSPILHSDIATPTAPQEFSSMPMGSSSHSSPSISFHRNIPISESSSTTVEHFQPDIDQQGFDRNIPLPLNENLHSHYSNQSGHIQPLPPYGSSVEGSNRESGDASLQSSECNLSTGIHPQTQTRSNSEMSYNSDTNLSIQSTSIGGQLGQDGISSFRPTSDYTSSKLGISSSSNSFEKHSYNTQAKVFAMNESTLTGEVQSNSQQRNILNDSLISTTTPVHNGLLINGQAVDQPSITTPHLDGGTKQPASNGSGLPAQIDSTTSINDRQPANFGQSATAPSLTNSFKIVPKKETAYFNKRTIPPPDYHSLDHTATPVGQQNSHLEVEGHRSHTGIADTRNDMQSLRLNSDASPQAAMHPDTESGYRQGPGIPADENNLFGYNLDAEPDGGGQSTDEMENFHQDLSSIDRSVTSEESHSSQSQLNQGLAANTGLASFSSMTTMPSSTRQTPEVIEGPRESQLMTEPTAEPNIDHRVSEPDLGLQNSTICRHNEISLPPTEPTYLFDDDPSTHLIHSIADGPPANGHQTGYISENRSPPPDHVDSYMPVSDADKQSAAPYGRPLEGSYDNSYQVADVVEDFNLLNATETLDLPPSGTTFSADHSPESNDLSQYSTDQFQFKPTPDSSSFNQALPLEPSTTKPREVVEKELETTFDAKVLEQARLLVAAASREGGISAAQFDLFLQKHSKDQFTPTAMGSSNINDETHPSSFEDLPSSTTQSHSRPPLHTDATFNSMADRPHLIDSYPDSIQQTANASSSAVVPPPFNNGNPLLRDEVFSAQRTPPGSADSFGSIGQQEIVAGSLDSFTKLHLVGVNRNASVINSLLQDNGVTNDDDMGWDVGAAPTSLADDILRDVGLDDEIQLPSSFVPEVQSDTGNLNFPARYAEYQPTLAAAQTTSKRTTIPLEETDSFDHRSSNDRQSFFRPPSPEPVQSRPPTAYPDTRVPARTTPIIEPMATHAELESMLAQEEEEEEVTEEPMIQPQVTPHSAVSELPLEDAPPPSYDGLQDVAAATTNVQPQDGSPQEDFLAEYMDLGATEPEWMPDSATNNCMNCRTAFSLLKRRHHCRACGKIFCANCSNTKSKLQYKSFREERVCRQCHELIAIATAQQERLMTTAQHPPPSGAAAAASAPPVSAAPPPPPGVLRDTSRVTPIPRDPSRVVMFSDGIRPGDENSQLDGTEGQPSSRVRRKNKNRARMNPKMRDQLRHTFLIPPDSLPPLLTKDESGTYAVVDEQPDEQQLVDQLKELGAESKFCFAIHKDLKIHCCISDMECCMKKPTWCFASEGLCTLSQDEVLFVLECKPEENTFPKDVFYFYKHLYQSASQGGQVTELSWSDTDSITCADQEAGFLGSKDHNGFLYIRPTYQCVKQLCLPEPPYLFALLLHRLEVPWARLFPVRLQLRLGAEFKYYPCPLFSVRNREPVYRENTNTIMNLLADFTSYNYSLNKIEGFTVHLQDKITTVSIPRNAHASLVKMLNSSQDAVLSFGASFSTLADSHLVCVQNPDGSYTAHAMNVHNQTRTITGASFVVFNGSLKETAGVTAKCSIVEDGIMVQITKDALEKLKTQLTNMEEFTIICGRLDDDDVANEQVQVVWVDDYRDYNNGVVSPIDSELMDGVPSLRVKNHVDYSHENYTIRWTEVFFMQVDEGRFAIDTNEISIFSDNISQSTSVALAPFLQQLHTEGMKKIGLRVSLGPEKVEYTCGSLGQKLQSTVMNSLDGELVPLLHSAVGTLTGGTDLTLELIFHILE